MKGVNQKVTRGKKSEPEPKPGYQIIIKEDVDGELGLATFGTNNISQVLEIDSSMRWSLSTSNTIKSPSLFATLQNTRAAVIRKFPYIIF